MKKLHLIGIGGIGLSALARHLIHEGYEISGSDKAASSLLESLSGEGAKIHIGHRKENIPKDCKEVIYSLAVDEKNEEFQEARKRGIPMQSYPEALGYFTKNKKNICIVGTHGKTTTTGMIGKLLIDGKKDPTIVIGTTIKEWENKNYRHGKSSFTVMEACEYKRAFLNFHPWIVIVTNIDLDHLDYYRNKNDYDKAFEEFLKKIPDSGAVIYHSDDSSSKKIIGKLHCRKIAVKKEKIELQIPGKHNQENAALALALGKFLKINEKTIKKSLLGFSGTGRRFEFKGTLKHENSETKIYDDYGHHPAEIQATLQGAREKFPQEKILIIFQPHQYSRTRFFLKQFGKSFKNADTIIIPNIYAARDTKKDKNAVSEKILAEQIRKNGQKVHTGGNIEKIKKLAIQHDIVITMGAGDIWKIAERLLARGTAHL